MFLPAISLLGSITPIGGRGIGWLGFWNLRRGSGRRSAASSAWPSFVGPTVLCVPAAAAWRLKARPRVYECATCHRQESVTAGTVLHRTRTDLSKWFVAAYLMGRDKRGVSAKFLQRELAVAYQTAWTMAHKLRHGLSEDPARPLRGL